MALLVGGCLRPEVGHAWAHCSQRYIGNCGSDRATRVPHGGCSGFEPARDIAVKQKLSSGNCKARSGPVVFAVVLQFLPIAFHGSADQLRPRANTGLAKKLLDESFDE